jgi:C-terminal processing protease CtpA/Prc
MDQMNLGSLPAYSGNDGHDFNRRLEQEGALALVVGGKVKAPYRGRVVLLIDQECASTTEAVAAAARESQVATLIGRRTAGAMLGADVIAVGGGWLVQIPVLDFRTAKGTRVEGVGVTPDISVKGRKAGEADADVERALKLLEHKQARRRPSHRANGPSVAVTWPGPTRQPTKRSGRQE